MKPATIITGQLQMVFSEAGAAVQVARVCPVCRQQITEAAPCPHLLGTSRSMFEATILFHVKAQRRGKRTK